MNTLNRSFAVLSTSLKKVVQFKLGGFKNWNFTHKLTKSCTTRKNVLIAGNICKDGKIVPLVCEVGTVGKISDCQPEGPGFNPRPGRGLNFGRPSFATPSVDRDVKPLF